MPSSKMAYHFNIFLFSLRTVEKRIPTMKNFLLPLLLAVLLPLTSIAQEKAVEVHYVDPLEKVFRETAFFVEKEARAEVVRGEHASLQFAVRSDREVNGLRASIEYIRQGEAQLRNWKIGYLGYVRVGRSTPNPSRDRLLPPSGLYPDPILEPEQIDLPKFTTQPVWISVPIPRDARPGMYTGRLFLEGRVGNDTFREAVDFNIEVFPPVVDRSSLWVTNWYNAEPDNLAHLNSGEPLALYSPKYWELLELLARKMAEYRQNVALISPLRLATYHQGKEGLLIDFANFDKTVEVFRKAGVIGRIEGGHIGSRESNWTSPFVVFVPVIEKDTTYFEKLSISDERAVAFYEQFFPALLAHLQTKGWKEIYLQHIADEPIAENVASYVAITKFVKKLAPELKIVEACHSRDLNEVIDVWVPQLNFLHEDDEFYQDRQAQGDEVWFYTCLAPQGEYANRFIELPLLKTRVLHWINYRFDIPGYLHWGLNFWRSGDPFLETTGIITESGNVLPGGDAWIIYPAAGKVLSSIRLEAMRDGIVDYELLRMATEKYPEEVRELARQVVYRYDLYDMNVAAFREKRRQLMEILSQNSNKE